MDISGWGWQAGDIVSFSELFVSGDATPQQGRTYGPRGSNTPQFLIISTRKTRLS